MGTLIVTILAGELGMMLGSVIVNSFKLAPQSSIVQLLLSIGIGLVIGLSIYALIEYV